MTAAGTVLRRTGSLKDSMVEIYDISQTLCEGMPIWPGDPQFHRNPVFEEQDGKTSTVSAFQMGAHTGTHIDAPLHLDALGLDISRLPIRHFIGPARVFSLSVEECIRAADLLPLDWRGVRRVLFRTQSGNPPEFSFEENFIYLHRDAAEFLAERPILLVGTDSPSVDAFDNTELTSHRILLQHEVMILENARLGNVPAGDYELICLPLKLAGFDGSPVRAILRK
jgi:arylformamidase